MKNQEVLVVLLLTVAVASVWSQGFEDIIASLGDLQLPIESSTAAILRSRGYIAQDYQVEVQNGRYTLNLVRALNPLINNGRAGLPDRDPLLFIHGIILNANCFIYMNQNVKPMNYSGYDIGSMSEKQLENLLRNDPGSQSLVFLALNFGYEVWLLNRRNTLESRKAHFARDISSGKFLFKQPYYYWNFSYDEQAHHDFPATIDRVLETTGKKQLILVTHSAGGTISLMGLTDRPELADKISKALLWAPVLDYKGTMFNPFVDAILIASLPAISNIMIPVPPQLSVLPIEGIVAAACSNDITRPLLCYPVADFLLGPGTSQLNIEELSFQNHWLEPIDSSEEIQLIQALQKTLMHRYDYYNPIRNFAVYGQAEPSVYNISRIESKSLTFWYGNKDGLAKAINFEITANRLSVPVEKYYIDGPGIEFNHLGFNLHKDIANLLIIPSLKVVGSTRSSGTTIN